MAHCLTQTSPATTKTNRKVEREPPDFPPPKDMFQTLLPYTHVNNNVTHNTRLLLSVHTFSVLLSLQLKKLRWHNESAIALFKYQSRSRSQGRTKVNGSHHGDNPLLRPTGIQIATKSLPDPTNREHGKLVGVKTMSLGTNYSFSAVWSGVLPAFQHLNYKLQRRSSDVLLSNQSH